MRSETVPIEEQCQTIGDTGNDGDKVDGTGSSVPPNGRGQAGDTGGTLPRSFRLDQYGLWHRPDDLDGEWQWICSPLHVTALTRNADGEAWGRLLEFVDPDGNAHTWACPMEMLASDGAEFRRVLLSMGLEIAPGAKARNLLATYVQSAKVERRAICTERTGWYRGRFVLPGETIGSGDEGERVLLQINGEPPKMGQDGTFEAWRDEIAARCVGNSRLVLAVSAAFAAPLLDVVGHEPGGIHLVGNSSTGKTTALKVAASVWGAPDYLHRWRSTTNGLEAVAYSHNDGLLVLDELAQVDPRQAGDAAYMLANGSGKHRARRDGRARKAAEWRLLFLSAGEIGLAEHMAEAGKRSRAGQEVRLADVPADTGEHGLFESLHGAASAAAFADELGQLAATHYGTPIRTYLGQLASLARSEVKARIGQLTADFIAETLPKNANGQARRVCARFALIAAGGELATKFGLTGWLAGEAIKAARVCFAAWLDRRGGTGSQEHARAIAQVRLFLENHGDARFADLDSHGGHSIRDRAGFRRVVDGKRQYLIFPETFKSEVCAGLDWQMVARTLRDEGLLVTEDVSHNTVKLRAKGRLYAVREAIHEG